MVPFASLNENELLVYKNIKMFIRVSWFPKLTTLKKTLFCHFEIDIIQTSPLQKVSEKKDLFYAKVWTKKG